MPWTIGISSDLMEELGRDGRLPQSPVAEAVKGGLDRETESLLRECARVFDEVILIQPSKVAVEFRDGATRARVWHDGRDISELSALVVRGTRGVEHSIQVMVQGLARCGCVIVDPLERFSGQRATKLDNTAQRWDDGIGSSSWVVGTETWRPLLDLAESEGWFPLILKPLRGRRGEGVRLLQDRRSAEEEIQKALPVAISEGVPLLIQEYVPFETEWRMTVVNGRVIGTVERIAPPGVITHNAATGATYRAVRVPDAEEFVTRHFPGIGIVGVDAARAPDGTLQIIEGNRGCQWGLFEDTTGVNVAREIAEDVLRVAKETL